MNDNKGSEYSIKLEELYPVIAEKLKSGGSVTFKPHGISMLPLIRQGVDSITIERPDKRPTVGDVIFYRRTNGQFVLHRIIGVDKAGYVLCGDNQWVKEHGITENQIIGVMTALLRDDEAVKMDNPQYIRYVKTLGRRRLYLRTKFFAGKVKGKLKRMFRA